MQNKVLLMTYASSLTNLCKFNSSFDTGVLRIAYPGVNRNGSRIDKETFEKCLHSIYNCPIVCNYDRETNSLGGHDVDVVRRDDGSLRIINITTPVGVIPESAKVFWQTVDEGDGVTREYLCADVLLWKRQEAYEKIKADGITAQSMEITVKVGETIDGVYVIRDFEFTAFALIGVEPCFESAALEFSKRDYKQQFAQMMLDIRNNISGGNSSDEDTNRSPQNNTTKGGTERVNKTSEVIDETVVLENIGTESKTSVDTADSTDGKFELDSNTRDELMRAVETEKVHLERGDVCRYWYVDFDSEASLVYCFDYLNDLLYGFEYELNGDTIVINWASKKRKKFAIVDFEGEVSEGKSAVEEIFSKIIELDNECKAANDQIENMTKEINKFKEYKANNEAALLRVEREKVFSRFEDLNGIDEFELLRADEDKYDPQTLEEKCYAIRGKNSIVRFSNENKTPKLPIERAVPIMDEPYGGLFQEYGVATNV